MRKRYTSLLVGLILITSCQAAPEPASAPTNTPASSTNTASLAATGTSTETPPPTPTRTPEPITASNLDWLQLTGFTDLGFEYPLVYQRAVHHLSTFVEPGREVAKISQNNWGAARWSADGEYLIVETSRGIDVLDGHTLGLLYSRDGFTPIDLLADGSVAALRGNQVVFLDILDGGITGKCSLVEADVSMSVSPPGDLLAYATGPGTITLVNLESLEEREFTITSAYSPVSISDISFSPDGSTLFATTIAQYGEDMVTLFEVASGEKMYQIPAAYPVSHASSSADYAYWDKSTGMGAGYAAHPSIGGDAQVVTATFPASIRARDPGRRMNYDSFAMSFVQDASTLGVLYVGSSEVYGAPNSLLYIWDLTTMQTRSIFNLGYPFNHTFAFSPDANRFFTAAFDGHLRLWDAETGVEYAQSEGYSFYVPASLKPDGSQLVIPYHDHFDILNREDLAIVDSVSYPAYSYPYGTTAPYDSRITYLPNDLISFWVGYAEGSTTISRSMKHTYTYDPLEHEILHRFDYGKPWESYYNCSFTRDGSVQICQLTDSEAIQFIDVAEVRMGTSIIRLRTDTIDHYALSRDGTTLAYCDGETAVISLVEVTGSNLRQINYACQEMVFLPGDERLLLADGQVVDLATKEVVGQFGFSSPWEEFPFMFFPEGQNYVLIGNQFHDLQTGEVIASLPTSSVVHDMAVTADGLTFIILTDRGLEYWQAMPE